MLMELEVQQDFDVQEISGQASLKKLKPDKCSEEGWLAPAQVALPSTLDQWELERGQATLLYRPETWWTLW